MFYNIYTKILEIVGSAPEVVVKEVRSNKGSLLVCGGEGHWIPTSCAHLSYSRSESRYPSRTTNAESTLLKTLLTVFPPTRERIAPAVFLRL